MAQSRKNIKIANYEIVRKDRPDGQGGVCLLIHKTINYDIIKMNENEEIITILIIIVKTIDWPAFDKVAQEQATNLQNLATHTRNDLDNAVTKLKDAIQTSIDQATKEKEINLNNNQLLILPKYIDKSRENKKQEGSFKKLTT